MNIEELEEALEDILPPGFHFGTDKKGQIIIYTQLSHGEDDEELIPFDTDEEDPDFDPDSESLSVLEDEDDDD